jgi:hypothetical protein
LHHDDVNNFVYVASNNHDNMPVVWPEWCEEFVTIQGVDFIYSKTLCSLNIQIRYSKSIANDPVIDKALERTTIKNQVIMNNDLDQWVSLM